jgi:hypothetical protein
MGKRPIWFRSAVDPLSAPSDPILTLEPLVDAVRVGVEQGRWVLSGLQKTTSHQFEGRWAGDSTRSAYLFFHRPTGTDWASVEVFLDETSRGLTGNLALVVDAAPLGALGDVRQLLGALAELDREVMPRGTRTPLTLRLHLPDPDTDAARAQTEIRFKVRIPRACVDAGVTSVTELAADTVERFNELLVTGALHPFLSDQDGSGPEAE